MSQAGFAFPQSLTEKSFNRMRADTDDSLCVIAIEAEQLQVSRESELDYLFVPVVTSDPQSSRTMNPRIAEPIILDVIQRQKNRLVNPATLALVPVCRKHGRSNPDCISLTPSVEVIAALTVPSIPVRPPRIVTGLAQRKTRTAHLATLDAKSVSFPLVAPGFVPCFIHVDYITSHSSENAMTA
jgi:hypothetical protein